MHILIKTLNRKNSGEKVYLLAKDIKSKGNLNSKPKKFVLKRPISSGHPNSGA